MHGAAHAVVEAVLPGEDLGQRAVEDKADGQLLDVVGLAELLHGPQGLAAEEVLHDVHQFLVGHLLDAGEALGQNLGVGPVGAEDDVVLVQQIGLADTGGLLAQGQVGGTGIGGLDAVVVGLGLNQGEHMLELAENGDVAVNADQVGVGVVGPLLGHGLVIGADRDVFKMDGTGSPGGYGVHKQRLGHEYTSFLQIEISSISQRLRGSSFRA